MNAAPIFLDEAALSGFTLSQSDCLDAVEAAIRSAASGELLTAPKSALVPGEGRYIMSTLSSSDASGLTVVKCVSIAPDNPSRGLASIEGAIMVLSAETGQLLAVMHHGWITAVRTACLSLAAARRLANPASARIGFIGCGVQARSHLDAFRAFFPITSISAFGRGAASRDRLIAHAQAHSIAAEAAETPDDALDAADIVVSSVPLDYSIKPFLNAERLKPGAYAAITDLGIPWRPETMTAFASVAIDDHAQEAASPKQMIAPDLVGADLKGLISGAEALSFDPEKRAAFLFRGLALGDFALAALAYRQATAS